MTRWELTLEVPLARPLPAGTNLREHPMARHARVKKLRELTALHLRTRGAAFLREWRVMASNEALRLDVAFTRISPRELDDDNNVSAFKAVRDQVAAEVGINDRSKRFDWHYLQAKGEPAIRLRLEVLTTEVQR